MLDCSRPGPPHRNLTLPCPALPRPAHRGPTARGSLYAGVYLTEHMVADSTFPQARVDDKWLFQGTSRGADLTQINLPSPGLGLGAPSARHMGRGVDGGRHHPVVSVSPCLLNMRPSHVNWQKICRLDRYPQCPGGKHGEGGLLGAYTRGGVERDPAREQREP